MSNMNSKIGYGAKTNLAQAIADKKIDSGDIVFTSDTSEAAFITSEGNPMYVKSRSTEEYTLNGTTIGALENGAIIPAGIDMDGFLAMISTKPIPAVYTRPTLSIANNSGQAAGNVEAGTSITVKLKATFTKNDAGNLTSIKIKQGSTELSTGTTSPLTYTGDAVVIGDETITFNATADYEAAPVKSYQNTPNESKENWFDAGSLSSSNYQITGKRYSFKGTGSGNLPDIDSDFVRGLTKEKLAPANGNTIKIAIPIGAQYIAFAYPATLRDVTKVRYEEGNDDGMAGNFTKHTKDVADARGGNNGLMSYKVYTYFMPSPSEAPMNFTITI